MVIQRDVAAPVWGWTLPGKTVTVSVDGRPVGSALAGEDGRWSVKIGPFQAGGPHTVRVEGNGEGRALENVLFGDVWLCSGQSNMNWPVRLSQNAEQEIQNANNPNIRSFNVGMYAALAPERLPAPGKWEPCRSEFSRNFTGVGYFFAREIEATQKVPVGILHASVGATAAEAWVSGEALRTHMPDDFTEPLDELDAQVAALGPGYDYFEALQKWTAAVDPESAKRRYSSDPELDTGDWWDIPVPKAWKAAGVPGLENFDGLVWFRHWVEVPEGIAQGDAQLVLSVVNDADIVWVNGRILGCMQEAGQRVYSVPAGLLKPGRNLLSVAVVNRKGQGGFVSNPNNMVLRAVPRTSQSVALAGMWKCRKGPALAELAPLPPPRTGNYKTITSFYNGMIAPLVPFALKGALWYQGEANGPFAQIYRRLLPTLIRDWRGRFGSGEFPFLIVSLANYQSPQTLPVEAVGWQEIRESQWRTARSVPNTGIAMTLDIGNSKDIHPRNKQEVGRRLALVARRKVYGEKSLVDSGPEFAGFEPVAPEGSKLRLSFQNTGGGLVIRPGDEKLVGFAVADADGDFFFADAVLEGNTVVVSAREVPRPQRVRYGWAWSPVVNLYNKEGLPAIPFRSDEDREALLIHTYANDSQVGKLAGDAKLEIVKLGPKGTARLTNAAIPALASLPNLKELTIVGTVLSFSGGLEHLQKAPRLKKLHLGRVALPDGDFEKLQAALPHVEMDFTPMPPELRTQFDAWAAAGK
jgi:sialate O-acetylesterase